MQSGNSRLCVTKTAQAYKQQILFGDFCLTFAPRHSGSRAFSAHPAKATIHWLGKAESSRRATPWEKAEGVLQRQDTPSSTSSPAALLCRRLSHAVTGKSNTGVWQMTAEAGSYV